MSLNISTWMTYKFKIMDVVKINTWKLKNSKKKKERLLIVKDRKIPKKRRDVMSKFNVIKDNKVSSMWRRSNLKKKVIKVAK